jgi:hypothetical protein
MLTETTKPDNDFLTIRLDLIANLKPIECYLLVNLFIRVWSFKNFNIDEK